MKRGSRGRDGGGEGEAWGGGAGGEGGVGRGRKRERNPASEQALFSVFYDSATAQYKNFVPSSILSSLRSHTVHIQDLAQQMRTAGWETGKPVSQCAVELMEEGDSVQNSHEASWNRTLCVSNERRSSLPLISLSKFHY